MIKMLKAMRSPINFTEDGNFFENGIATKTEEVRFEKQGAALQRFIKEVAWSVAHLKVRLTPKTIVVSVRYTLIGQINQIYFVGDTEEMLPLCKYAAYIGELNYRQEATSNFRGSSFKLLFKGIGDDVNDLSNEIFWDFVVHYALCDPSYVLFRAFEASAFPKSEAIEKRQEWKALIEKMDLDAAAAALALILDEGCSIDDALAMAKA